MYVNKKKMVWRDKARSLNARLRPVIFLCDTCVRDDKQAEAKRAHG